MDSKSDGLIVLTELGNICRRNLALLVGLALLGMFAGLLLLSRKESTYRGEAIMLLDSNRSAGVLGELAALTTAPQAVSEMEILRSRSLAEEVVRGADANVGELTTLVDSMRLAPLRVVLGSDGVVEWRELGHKPRLTASITSDPRRMSQPILCVEFLSANRVRIAKRGALHGLGIGGSDELELDFVAGQPFEYDGMKVSLEPDGDLAGEGFYLRSLKFEDAVAKVTKRTRVSETERNSGVIRVVYEDSDPERAAATTNALCALYLKRNELRNEKRASQTVDFIEAQLKEQLAALETAEREVVELQRKSPQSVDIGATGEALIEHMTSLQVEEVQLRMMLSGLQEALERLDKGDLDALSRLEAGLSDPVTRGYVEQISLLTTEATLLGRADSGAFKGLVQSKQLQLETESESIGVKIAGLEQTVNLLAAGDASALGSLVTTERAGTPDTLLSSYLERWTELDNRTRELQVEFTEELPELRTLTAQRTDLEARLLEILRGRLDGYRTQMAAYADLMDSYKGRMGNYPGEERSQISLALDSLRERTVVHLTQRLTGLYSRLSKLRDEKVKLENSLAELPEDVRVLADPTRRREAHAEIVKFLLSRQKEAEITRAATVASAEIIDIATPAREPRGPFAPLFLLGGALLGLGLALGLGAIRQSLDRGVYTTEELELASGLALFGSIPDYRRGICKVPGVGKDFLALRDDPEGPIAEAYRSLRSNLKFVLNTGQQGLEIRTIAFTSCTESEGKSVTNADMALAFGMTGRRVLLVDADMRRPSISSYLQTKVSPGLSDVLKGEVSWRETVQVNVATNVDVIPAGEQPASPGDLFAGDITGRFIQEVRDAYDIVVFDVPPVLAVADIDCLAAKLDALLLLTRSGRLSNKVVREGVRRLQQVGGNLVGCVVNAARATRGEKKYGYGYGYGYGSQSKEVA